MLDYSGFAFPDDFIYKNALYKLIINRAPLVTPMYKRLSISPAINHPRQTTALAELATINANFLCPEFFFEADNKVDTPPTC